MKILLSLTLGYISFLAGQSLVMAKPVLVNSSVNQPKKVSFNPPAPPATEPPPGGRVRGGARRNPCPAAKPPLTALVPYTEGPPTVINVWGLTAEAHPTLMFYMPYPQSTAYPTEFVLQDQQSNTIYQKAIALPENPGIISVPVPDNIPLEVNKRYRWFLTVDCDPQQDSAPTYVEGVIKRVTLDEKVTQELATATPLQRFDIYLRNGIWHEALKTISQLRQENPKNQAIQEKWLSLLTSIRLDDVASQPLLSQKP